MTATLPPRTAALLAAAQDALARSDEGADPLPGDAALIDAYERLCQQEWDRFERARYEAQRQEWLGSVCGECEDGGYGPPCDEHYLDADTQFTRSQDL